eukprot:59624-Rhodomonas_salina.1
MPKFRARPGVPGYPGTRVCRRCISGDSDSEMNSYPGGWELARNDSYPGIGIGVPTYPVPDSGFNEYELNSRLRTSTTTTTTSASGRRGMHWPFCTNPRSRSVQNLNHHSNDEIA